MDHYRTAPALDPPHHDSNPYAATFMLDVSGEADDPLGDEAAFPSTWQSLVGVEPFSGD